MTVLNVSSNLRQAILAIKHTRDQIPFGAATGLTELARIAQAAIVADMPSTFTETGRPTNFTLQGIGWKKATKSNLVSEVFVKPKQLSYLSLEEYGGTRLPSGKKLSIPVNAPKNSYGKMPRNFVSSHADASGFFIGTVHGKSGLYQRLTTGRGKGKTFTGHVRLIVYLFPRGNIKPKWHFETKVAKVVSERASEVFAKNLAKAMATAK